MTQRPFTQDNEARPGRAKAAGDVAIRIRGVNKNFGHKSVLRGVDLDILGGETHVILGRSGTGKSVILKLVMGLMLPDEGDIEVEGQPLDGPEAIRIIRRRVQMLFQGAALFDSMTVAENVALRAVEHGELKPAQAAEYAEEFLELVDLGGAGDKMPAELSGGMKKRAALARALAGKPHIMLYDEPTTGLDPLTGQVINRLIRVTQERFKVTSIVVTHDLRSAMEVGDRCSFLHEGRILQTCPPHALSESPHALIQNFIRDAVVQC